MALEASGPVGIWDIGTGKPQLFSSITTRAIDAAFSPDGKFVATACLDGTIRWWTIDGQPKWVSQGGHKGRARAVAVAADYIASGGEDGTIQLWRLDGTPLAPPLAADNGSVVSVAISSRGDLVSLTADDTVHMWKRTGGAEGGAPNFESKVLHQPETPRDKHQFLKFARQDPTWGWDHSVGFSPNGEVIAATLFDASLRLWNTDGSSRAVVVDAHRKRPVRALSFSPQGDVLATAGFDGMLRWWNLNGAPVGTPIEAHYGIVYSVAFSSKADRLATTGRDNLLRVWNRDGSLAFDFPRGHEDRIVKVALAPDAPILAAADDKGGIRLWNFNGTARGTPIDAHEGSVNALTFSAKTGTLASGGQDGTVRLWDSDGAPQGKPMVVGAPIAALAYSPKDDALAVGTAPFQVWKNGQRWWQQAIRISDYVQAIAFSSTGDFILSGSWLGWLQIWNADGTSQAVRTKQGKEFTRSVAVAPSNDFIAAAIGGTDTLVQLFNLDLTPRGAPLQGYIGSIAALAFSPKGELVTGGADGVVRFWTLPDLRVETIDVGMPVNQLGYWRKLLWVRAAGEPTFLHETPNEGEIVHLYNTQHALVATMVLRRNSALAFTPDGWFAGSDRPLRFVDLYTAAGEFVSTSKAARRMNPDRVTKAILDAAG